MAKTAISAPGGMQQRGSAAERAAQGAAFTQIPGSASFAAAASDGSLWVLSTNPAGNDKYVWHYANGAWTNISGLASRLAVAPDGTLYAINSGGGVYAYHQSAWTALGGGASDLTVGSDGSIYVLSNGRPSGGDQALWRYSNGWMQISGSGVRIAASRAAGGIYVLNSTGDVFYENRVVLHVPGASALAATKGGGLYVLAEPSYASGTSLYYSDLKASAYKPQAGSAVSVSSDGGKLYIVSASGGIYFSLLAAAEPYVLGGAAATLLATAGKTPAILTLPSYGGLSATIQFTQASTDNGTLVVSDALNNGDVTPTALPADNATLGLTAVLYLSFYNPGSSALLFGAETPRLVFTKPAGFGGATRCELDRYNANTWTSATGEPATLSGTSVIVSSVTEAAGDVVNFQPGQQLAALACGAIPAVHREFAFVANEGSHNVSGFSINTTTGALTPVAGSPFAAGTDPTSVAVDATGRFAYVANQNYSAKSGSVSAYAISASTGVLTAVSGSPFASAGEPYGMAVDPAGKFAYVPNVYSDSVSAYTIDQTTAALTSIAGSPFATTGGSEPEGVTVDPTGRFVYVPDSGSNNVSAYTITATGALTAVPGSPFKAGTTPQGVLNVAVDPAGKFLYVTGDHADAVSAYTINAGSGALTAVAGSPFATGTGPEAVAIDPTGKFAYVANAGSNNVSAYTINAASGALAPLTGSPYPAATGPQGAAVDPTGKFLYVPNAGVGTISGYSISAATGALTPLAGSPFAAGGTTPFGIAVTSLIPAPIPTYAISSLSIQLQYPALPLGQQMTLAVTAKNAGGAVIAGTFDHPIVLSSSALQLSAHSVATSNETANIAASWANAFLGTSSGTVTATADGHSATATVAPQTGFAFYALGSNPAWDDTGFKLQLGPDGDLYYGTEGPEVCTSTGCIPSDGAVGQFSPTTLAVHEIELHSGASGLLFTSDGALWVSGGASDKLFRLPPGTFASSAIQTITVPSPSPSHAYWIREFAQEGGSLWFTDVGGGRVLKIPVAGPYVSTSIVGHALPPGPAGTVGLRAQGFGIAYGKDGNLYVSDWLNGLVDRVAPATGTTTAQILTPEQVVLGVNDTSSPRFFAHDGAGLLYLTLSGPTAAIIPAGSINNFMPGTGPINIVGSDSPLVLAGSSPYAIGANGSYVYYADQGAEGLGLIAETNHTSRVYPISQFSQVTGTLRFPDGVVVLPDGTAWFTCYGGVTASAAQPLCMGRTVYLSNWSIFPSRAIVLSGIGNANAQIVGVMEAPSSNSGPFTAVSNQTGVCKTTAVADHNFNIVGVARGSCSVTVTDAHAVSETIQVTVPVLETTAARSSRRTPRSSP